MDVIERIDKSLKKTEPHLEFLHQSKSVNTVAGRYKDFFDALDSAAVIYLPQNDGNDFVIVDINSAAESLEEKTKSEILGRSISDVFPKSRSNGVMKVLASVYRTGQPEHFHIRSLKDGLISGWKKNYVFKLPSGELARLYSCDTKRRQMDQKSNEHWQKLRELTSELSLSEERQRRKIAANLHDQLSQWLAISAMKLSIIRDAVDSEVAEEIDEVTETVRNAIGSVRELIYDLSSPTLYRFGLEAAVFEYITTLFKKHDDIKCELIPCKEKIELQEDVSVLLFQSIRELLFNVIKYAKANYVVVEMKLLADCYQVKVCDDGVGFDVSRLRSFRRSGGFGLFHMAERLEYIGGELKIDSEPAKGSRFCLQVPCVGTKRSGD